MAFNQREYINQYNKQNYCRIVIRIPKSKKTILDNLTKTKNKSLNRIFIEAVEKQHNVDLTLDFEKLTQSE